MTALGGQRRAHSPCAGLVTLGLGPGGSVLPVSLGGQRAPRGCFLRHLGPAELAWTLQSPGSGVDADRVDLRCLGPRDLSLSSGSQHHLIARDRCFHFHGDRVSTLPWEGRWEGPARVNVCVCPRAHVCVRPSLPQPRIESHTPFLTLSPRGHTYPVLNLTPKKQPPEAGRPEAGSRHPIDQLGTQLLGRWGDGLRSCAMLAPRVPGVQPAPSPGEDCLEPWAAAGRRATASFGVSSIRALQAALVE